MILWILTKLRYAFSGAYIGLGAGMRNTRFGNHFRLFARSKVYNCTIGDDCHIGVDCKIRNADIGNNVAIAEGVIIGVQNRRNKRVVIEDNATIFTRSVVLEGVRIGEGSTVGMMTAVRSNVKRGVVVNGNPAKVLRKQYGHKKAMG